MNQHVLILSLSWLAYFLLHSLLASLWFKQVVNHYCPRCAASYRLAYNILATLLLLPLLLLMMQWQQAFLWSWKGGMLWFMNAMALLSILGFVVTLKYYDMAEFIGLRQLQTATIEDQEQFSLSPLHHFVRHPWYFFGLVILWTRSMDIMMLVSVMAMTLYFIIGSWLEERKLVHYHGDIYLRYQKRVPALIPLPWRFLRSGEKL